MFLRFFVLEINPTLSVSSANSKNDVSIISSNMLSPLNCNENAGWPFDLIVTLPLGNFRRFTKFITGEISLGQIDGHLLLHLFLRTIFFLYFARYHYLAIYIPFSASQFLAIRTSCLRYINLQVLKLISDRNILASYLVD